MGDKLIICTYAPMNEEEVANYKPKIVLLGDGNRIKEIKAVWRAGGAPRTPAAAIGTDRDVIRRSNMELVNHTVINLIIFVLAIYVGYHVVWTVTPALHTPLMAVTNAISAIIIVGAMLAAGLTQTGLGRTMGVVAVALAAVNVFGGFLVTQRMLEMFKKKATKAGKNGEAQS